MFLRRKKRQGVKGQTTWCYCVGCDQDLCSRVNIDGTTFVDPGDGEQVVYNCGTCGTISMWDFDIYPVPFLIYASQHRSWRLSTDDNGYSIIKETRYDE